MDFQELSVQSQRIFLNFNTRHTNSQKLKKKWQLHFMNLSFFSERKHRDKQINIDAFRQLSLDLTGKRKSTLIFKCIRLPCSEQRRKFPISVLFCFLTTPIREDREGWKLTWQSSLKIEQNLILCSRYSTSLLSLIKINWLDTSILSVLPLLRRLSLHLSFSTCPCLSLFPFGMTVPQETSKLDIFSLLFLSHLLSSSSITFVVAWSSAVSFAQPTHIAFFRD